MSVRSSGARVEELLAAFDAPLPPVRARATAEELTRELVRLYGDALGRIVDIIDAQNDDVAGAICERLCGDTLLSGLLAVHGLHPLSTRERLERALDGVRPYIQSHRGAVEVVGIDDGVVTLRMSGSCDGCPSSESTFRLAIERAVLDACPELSGVRAEGMQRASTLRLISDWLPLESLPAPEPGSTTRSSVAGVDVVIVRTADGLYAYRNRCASCLREFAEVRVDGDALTCTSCGARFDVVHAGRSLERDVQPLEPYPLLVEDGRVRLAVPVTA